MKPGIARALVLSVALGGPLLPLGGCFDVRSVDPGVEVLPDAFGRVTRASNALEISGYWYAYGDRYDYPSRCTDIGKHPASDCSRIDTPVALPQIAFYNAGGKMCTVGRVAVISKCSADAVIPCDGLDYSNIWGAGIGLDFGLDVTAGADPSAFVRKPLTRKPWDAKAHHIAGVSFDFSLLGVGTQSGPRIRVEFPFVLPDNTPLPGKKGTVGLDPGDLPVLPDTSGVLPDHPSPPTEEYPSGSPIWGTTTGEKFTNDLFSPVHEGYNELRFDSLVAPPESDTNYYVFEPSQPLGIQFHVPASEDGAIDYGFCISNLVFIRD